MNARHAAVVAAVVVAVAGCDGPQRPPSILGDADAARGREALVRYGCGACHQIPGVRGARGIVGPSLDGVASRRYLAGRVINEPHNLIAWIRTPRTVDPQTIMPDLAVSEPDARDMAAFLYRSAREDLRETK